MQLLRPGQTNSQTEQQPDGFVSSKGLPAVGWIIGLDQNPNMTAGECVPTYSYKVEHWSGDFWNTAVKSPGLLVKKIHQVMDRLEPGKDGFNGKLNKDAIEQQIDAGNRYITGSNIFSQFFTGV